MLNADGLSRVHWIMASSATIRYRGTQRFISARLFRSVNHKKGKCLALYHTSSWLRPPPLDWLWQKSIFHPFLICKGNVCVFACTLNVCVCQAVSLIEDRSYILYWVFLAKKPLNTLTPLPPFMFVVWQGVDHGCHGDAAPRALVMLC